MIREPIVMQIPEVFEGFKWQYLLKLFKLGCGSWRTQFLLTYSLWCKCC